MKQKKLKHQTQPKVGLEEQSDIKSNDIEQSITDELVSDKSDSDSFKSEKPELGGSLHLQLQHRI